MRSIRAGVALTAAGHLSPARPWPRFFMHAMVSTVLLLNMLIAMMGETFSEIRERAEYIWFLERADLILTYVDGCRFSYQACHMLPLTKQQVEGPSNRTRITACLLVAGTRTRRSARSSG